MYNWEMDTVDMAGDTTAPVATTGRPTTMEDAIHSGMTPATMITIPANLYDMVIITTISRDTTIFTKQDIGIVSTVVVAVTGIKRQVPVL